MADIESVPVAREASASSPNPTTTTDADASLSKNARKRLLKAERFAASKAERRARDKEKRQEKKRERAEKRRAGDVDALNERKTKRRRIADSGPRTPFRARVVVDLAFDDKMSEKEVVSLCSQLSYTYSANRKARFYFDKLLYSSLDGKTFARLEALGGQYKRWNGVEFWNKGYENLWEGIGVPKESVVYLTGDAEDELQELREGETYIIGGICDRNRYKNICLNKSKEQSIRSARLPIGKYLENFPTRKILTVNQVFEILINWIETRDWSKALYAVMPKRKFQQGSQSVGGAAKDAGDDPEEAYKTGDAVENAGEFADAIEDINEKMQDQGSEETAEKNAETAL